MLVHWYANSQNAEVITYCADVGQEEELDGLEEKAMATGAKAHRTLDLVDEFATDFIYPMVRGNAIYESQYLLGTSIARPLIAKAQIEIARNLMRMQLLMEQLAREMISVDLNSHSRTCTRFKNSRTLERCGFQKDFSRTETNDRILQRARY